MAIHEAQGLSGRLTIELRAPGGRVVTSRRYDNLITTSVQRALAEVAASFPALPDGQRQVLREAGVLVSVPRRADLLYNRMSFPGITETTNPEMTLTWEPRF